MRTLIIVDAQVDFMPGGSLPVPGGDLIVGPLNAVQERFDLVVATQDWHPVGHLSFASSHAGKKPFEVVDLCGIPQTLWPDHCVQGSGGAGFPGELRTDRVEAVFRKGMDPHIDSYSAFFDNRRQKTTGLAGYLREKGVKVLHFGGLAADICVYFTVRDALDLGFAAVVVTDAVRALDENAYASKEKELKERGVHFVGSASVQGIG